MINKLITPSNNGNSHNVDYQSTGKVARVQPTITEKFMQDDGETMLILSNGSQSLEKDYNRIWGSGIKGVVNWKGRGENPDGRKRGLQ
jgi:hypothetical protein